MKLHGEMYRKDGQWVIEIESKAWIIDDILYDVARIHQSVKVVIAENPYSFGGQSYRDSSLTMETNKPKVITADVVFDVEAKDVAEGAK